MALRQTIGIALLALSFGCAHSWYPPECCSDKDCAPLDERLVLDGGLDYVIQGVRFPKLLTRPSPDDKWHWCPHIRPYDGVVDRIHCVWRPFRGT